MFAAPRWNWANLTSPGAASRASCRVGVHHQSGSGISGAFDPVPFPAGSDFAKIAINDWGAIRVDENQMTSVPWGFAGGDIVRGASLVVHAVRDGRKAALGIHRQLHALGK